jgi:hypothetical protein
MPGTESENLTLQRPKTSSTTSTRAFLDILRAAKPDQQLVFQLDEASLVAAGYHVTEVKAVTYNTMDCGGVADKWKETVIQLWNPGDEPEREPMTVRKFLAIYERVAKHIPVSYDAELRFEYGDTRRPAASYHVERLESRGALILVHPPRSHSDLQGKGSKKGQSVKPGLQQEDLFWVMPSAATTSTGRSDSHCPDEKRR